MLIVTTICDNMPLTGLPRRKVVDPNARLSKGALDGSKVSPT